LYFTYFLQTSENSNTYNTSTVAGLQLVIAGYYPLNRPPRRIIASVIIILELITLGLLLSAFQNT